MTDGTHIDPAKLAVAREEVQTFLKKKKKLTTLLWIAAGTFETTFFVLMLVFMDFGDRFNWFIMFGFLMTYMPLITFTWRNAVMIDRLYYRLVADLKYDEGAA